MAEINQGIINSGSIGGNASVSIVQQDSRLNSSAGVASALRDSAWMQEMDRQVALMRSELKTVSLENQEAADRAGRALDHMLGKIDPVQNPDGRAVEVSTKGLLEATREIAKALPSAGAIAALLAKIFGFQL